MACHSFLTILVSLYVIVVCQSKQLSFTTQLIHIDSVNSPFFDASETPLQRFTNALRRSFDRVNKTKSLLPSAAKAFQSPLLYYNGDYLIRVVIGTTETLLNFALSSDITWVPCLNGACSSGCNGRVFDPTQSSTFQTLPCHSKPCQMTSGASCMSSYCVLACSSESQGNCPAGVLSTDTFILPPSSSDQTIRLPDTGFICGNGVTYEYPGVGIIGLANGSLSLLSRIYHLIDGTFSYCLVPYATDQPSRMSFGLKGIVLGSGVVSTPLLPMSSSYILRLNGIQVGHKKLSDQTVLYIDPGIMFTHLPDTMYSRLVQRVRNRVRQEPVQTDNSQGLSLCYRFTPDFDPPVITMRFEGGDLILNARNSFARIAEDTICLAFASSSEGEAVFGSWQQMNFLVGYDLKNGYVSFKRTDCTQFV